MSRSTHYGRKLILTLAALAAAAPVLAGPYKNLRYEEDPRAMVNPEKPDFWDPIKAISLSKKSDAVFSFGGQARLRWEFWNNFGFVKNNDDDFGLLRLRLHGDLQPWDFVRVFVEGKSALSSSRDLPGGRRTLDVDTAALQNAFIDLAADVGEGGRFTLRTGRQELQYGKQRLVSPLDWANTRRTFDGVRGIFSGEKGRIDAFWASLATVNKYDENSIGTGPDLFGAYATGTCPLTGLGGDLYYLGLDRDQATYGDVTGDELRHTLGLRLGGKIADTAADVDVEGGYQFGDFAESDISAYFFASQAGYTVQGMDLKPRLYLGFDYASGDRDGKGLNTFNQLFPLGHAYLGYIDIVGRQNIIDFSQGLVLWPVSKKLLTKLEGHFFWRAEDTDALYHAGGGVVRPGDSGSSTEVGAELDFTLKYLLDQHTVFLFGYSHFFAGDFIKESGPSEDIDFAYASVQYTF